MFKKVLKILGSFFLVSFILFAGLGVYTYVTAGNETADATPYLDEAMPVFTTWDYEQFSPYLSEGAKEAFNNENGKKLLRALSRLGEPESFESPQFLGSKVGGTVEHGSFDLVAFSILGHFSNGDAQFTITLNRENEGYSINHININSDVFIN